MPSPSPPWLPGIQPSSFTLSCHLSFKCSYLISYLYLLYSISILSFYLSYLLLYFSSQISYYNISSAALEQQVSQATAGNRPSQVRSQPTQVRSASIVVSWSWFRKSWSCWDFWLRQWCWCCKACVLIRRCWRYICLCVHYGRTFMVMLKIILISLLIYDYFTFKRQKICFTCWHLLWPQEESWKHFAAVFLVINSRWTLSFLSFLQVLI